MSQKTSKERKTIFAKKEFRSILQILKQRDLSCRIAELTEELEKLKSKKALLLQTLQYSEDAGADTIRKDIAAMEAGLKRQEQQKKECADELANTPS